MPEEEGISQKRRKSGAYKDAGVDIDAGHALVDAIRPLADATARAGVASGLGGFGALFDLKAAGFEDPVLVAATDGVGTKLLVAEAAGRLDAVGVDLVAMCANDVVAQGAEPLFFLDYLATGRLDVDAARDLVAGIAEGCRQAGSALIGGETAEMPGLVEPGRYELAGFCVGAIERGGGLALDGAPGDAVLGLASSGLHANGFSLVRRIVRDRGLDYAEPAPFDPDRALGRALLDPTRIYVKGCLAAIATGGVSGLAHITGGGLVDNIPRALPAGVVAALDADRWPLPGVFGWLAAAGGLEPADMARTFNCGIGMVVVARADRAGAVEDALTDAGELVFRIGVIEDAPGDIDDADAGIAIDGIEGWTPS